MSRSCATTKCNRTSRGLCDCCQQNLCIQHLSEHNASLVSQLNPLTDEINALGDRFKSLNIEKAIDSCRRKLEQWRDDCYQKIDRLFQQKCRELDQLADQKVKKYHQEILQIQVKIAELVHEEETTRQDIDSLTSAVHHLQEKISKIEHTSFDIKARPLMIDESYIHLKDVRRLDLSTFPSVYKIINRPIGSKLIISSNDRYLLIHRKPCLCLIDQEMNLVNEALWSYDTIRDMYWSSVINRFILVEKESIFLMDDERMAIDNVKTIEERDWLSCTCSESSLFLSTNGGGSSIVKYTLLPTIEFAKEWKSPQTCAKDEIICNIVYNEETLGMVIKNQTEKSWRLELRSAEKLDCFWSLRFDSLFNEKKVSRCCLLTWGEWLVVDHELKRLLHVTKNGKLKTIIPYHGIPYDINIFANMLVVSRNGGVNFHKL